MSWTSSRDVHASIGLTVGRDVEIGFIVSPISDSITLVIGESTAEITFDPSMVETLRDKADEAARLFREAIAEAKPKAAGESVVDDDRLVEPVE